MKISVSAPSGLEGVTKRELYNLLKVDAPANNGSLTFDGDIVSVAKCNLFLRTASRVYIVLGSFKAPDFDSLFDGVYNIPVEDYIAYDGKILINATLVESKLTANSATCSIVKKAICKRLQEKSGKNLPETCERYKISVSIHRDYATVYLDTSGEGLHKRGYRTSVGDAPLKENVASALIDLSVWNADRPFVDLFCGSGTLPIEACLKALNEPPGLNRDFDFLHFKNFNTSFFNEMKETAKSQIKHDINLRISGFDIEESQIKLARIHAEKAGVSKYIHLQRADMREFSSRFSHGVIITNPPYGERLLTRNEIVKLYRDFGKVYSSLDNWSCYALTSVTDFERLFNKKADKKRKIYNGKLECTYFSVLGAPPKKNTIKY